jgi:hypothetical protein
MKKSLSLVLVVSCLLSACGSETAEKAMFEEEIPETATFASDETVSESEVGTIGNLRKPLDKCVGI